jgi:hypothetical protein
VTRLPRFRGRTDLQGEYGHGHIVDIAVIAAAEAEGLEGFPGVSRATPGTWPKGVGRYGAGLSPPDRKAGLGTDDLDSAKDDPEGIVSLTRGAPVLSCVNSKGPRTNPRISLSKSPTCVREKYP